MVDLALLLLRLTGLGVALAHGRLKVSALAAGGGDRIVQMTAAIGFPRPRLFAWAAGLSELVGGCCLALGLATRLAAVMTLFTMLVAIFGHHRAHRHLLAAVGLPGGVPKVDDPCGLELAAVYLVVFFAILLFGPGRYSLDHLFGLPLAGAW